MGILSIRELNSNVSKAIARVEAGETLSITRSGRVVAEIRPKKADRLDDPELRQAYDEALALMQRRVSLGGRASYDERTR
jgi:antitoxin (DNA-binding transcriptional repressor) of toxin-antitoxin stability system